MSPAAKKKRTPKAQRIKATEIVPIKELIPHPQNYHSHPEDQKEHIKKSLTESGFYKNVVTARDLTLLAGHGVVESAGELGWTEVPIVRLDLDPMDPAALRILLGDNEQGKLAIPDDRLLTEILKTLAEDEDGLVGTGYDNSMLAALLFTTRPRGEIADYDTAAEWVGMPEFEAGVDPRQLVIHFREPVDRETFVAQHEIHVNKKFETGKKVWSAWWPARPLRDMEAVQFVEEGAQAE